jgi:hypothetical protein
VDAPHQSDPRSDSKKRAEDRMTERSARERRTNEREREREVVRKQNCEEHPHADTRKKIEARTKHAMISQSSDVLLSCGGF